MTDKDSGGPEPPRAGRSEIGADVGPVPEPQGKLLGMPYDVRPLTVARVKSRWWNPRDPRLLTPKAFGWGYDLNLYWIAHPLQAARRKGPTQQP